MSAILMQAEALTKVIANNLVGQKITGVVQSQDKTSVGFKLANGTVAWVDCDPEGNGMGWLAIEKK